MCIVDTQITGNKEQSVLDNFFLFHGRQFSLCRFHQANFQPSSLSADDLTSFNGKKRGHQHEFCYLQSFYPQTFLYSQPSQLPDLPSSGKKKVSLNLYKANSLKLFSVPNPKHFQSDCTSQLAILFPTIFHPSICRFFPLSL